MRKSERKAEGEGGNSKGLERAEKKRRHKENGIRGREGGNRSKRENDRGKPSNRKRNGKTEREEWTRGKETEIQDRMGLREGEKGRMKLRERKRIRERDREKGQ